MKGYFPSNNFKQRTGLFTTVKSHPSYEKDIKPILTHFRDLHLDDNKIENLIQYLIHFDSLMDSNKERTNDFGIPSLKKASEVKPYQELSTLLKNCDRNTQKLIFDKFIEMAQIIIDAQ